MIDIEQIDGPIEERTNQEMAMKDLENVEAKRILDSGQRREFETGAVRDIQEGKGRCDLLPLSQIGIYLSFYKNEDGKQIYEGSADVLNNLNEFLKKHDKMFIYSAIAAFMYNKNSADGDTPIKMVLELSKHYEEGAKKYEERNWERGIPAHCFLDSGVRHYLKYLDKWEDEPHDRAFLWNMFGLIWTLENHPELDDLPKYVILNEETETTETTENTEQVKGELVE